MVDPSKQPASSHSTPAEASRERSRGLGIQGRLVLAFAVVLGVAVLATCWVFVFQTRSRLTELIGENARQVSATLSRAAASAMEESNRAALQTLADDLVKGRNVVSVAFFASDGELLALGSRDIEQKRRPTPAPPNPRSLMQLTHHNTATLGEHVEVAAPVLAPTTGSTSDRANGRLLGYVTVGMSLSAEAAQLQRIATWGAIAGLGVVLLSIPLSYTLVRRLLSPIRELADATRRITGGDLDTQVSVPRDELVGRLACAFNDMVTWIRQQQGELAAMNVRLGEANRELESRIEQRTAQLETANKRLSQEIAEKEDFLRAVSHDLNAPLRNIDGMVQMLLVKKSEQLDDDVLNRLERIKKNVEVETNLINELLELSRIKTRRQRMELVEIEAMVWEIRGLFENDLRTKGIDLIVDTTLPVLNCERARIRQVFQNLIDNAIKYMGERERREIHVGCTINLTEAEFYVRDTGIGIHPEDLDKVFHVFRRGRNTQATQIAGKGVGLASVKSIIETYSGRIWVESELGKGTTFRFTINGQYVPRAASVGAGGAHSLRARQPSMNG
jgi:signal transduction histidine kinase